MDNPNPRRMESVQAACFKRGPRPIDKNLAAESADYNRRRVRASGTHGARNHQKSFELPLAAHWMLSTLWQKAGLGLECSLEFPLPKFEECLQRLEKLVDQLEKGDIPLEQALKLFEEGIQLSNSCRKELEEAEGKVEILLKQNGKLQPEPFEAFAERSEGKK